MTREFTQKKTKKFSNFRKDAPTILGRPISSKWEKTEKTHTEKHFNKTFKRKMTEKKIFKIVKIKVAHHVQGASLISSDTLKARRLWDDISEVQKILKLYSKTMKWLKNILLHYDLINLNVLNSPKLNTLIDICSLKNMTQLYATYKKLTVDLRVRQRQKNKENESGIRFFHK